MRRPAVRVRELSMEHSEKGGLARLGYLRQGDKNVLRRRRGPKRKLQRKTRRAAGWVYT
jgi:hypothetical protein